MVLYNEVIAARSRVSDGGERSLGAGNMKKLNCSLRTAGSKKLMKSPVVEARN